MDNSYWTIQPPSVQPPSQSVNFPAIDKVRGPGGAAKMLQDEQRLGGQYGFLQETIGPIADEINAGVSAANDYVTGKITGHSAGLGELYNDYKTIANTEQATFRKDHPVATVAANLLGGLAIGAPSAAGNALVGSAPAAARAGNALIPALKQGAKAGAVFGGITGAAEGTDPLGRAEGAATGAVAGAALGAAVPLVTNLTQRVVGAAQNLMGLHGAHAERQANTMVAEALRRDGITPADLMIRNSAGKPIVAADLGPNTQALAGAVNRQGGEGKAILQQFLEDRTQGQYGRMTADITAGTGVHGRDFAQTATDIAQRRAAAAAPGYASAYALPAPQLSDNAVSILGTPDGRAAVRTAERMMGNNRSPVTDADGHYTVEMLDQIQRAMRDRANGASGARAGEMAGNLNTLRGQFLQELPPELHQVMSNYRTESELIDAMTAGRQFLRGDAETLAAGVRNMTPAQADMYRLGVARELRSKMGSKIDSGDISGMFQNPQMRERLRPIFPSLRMFQEFMDNVATERLMQNTRNTILKGSQTAGRSVDDAAFGAGALGEFASDVASGGAHGVGVVRAVANAAVRGKDRIIQGVNENVARNVAQTLTNPDLATVGRSLTGRSTGTALQNYTVGQAPMQIGRAGAVALGQALTGGTPVSGNYWTIIPPEARP